MTIIQQGNPDIMRELGPNIMDNSKKHRLLKYLIIEDVDNGKAIHNELTRGFIWIPNVQWDTIYGDRSIDYIDYLWQNYFLVNEDFDEEKIQLQLKDRFRPKATEDWYLKNGFIKDYTIFTTMACNARCAYCYEKGRPQRPMKAETAKEVGNYIVKSAMKNGSLISLRWFGGEPLVNEHAIDIICQIVQDAGFNYQSTITSNGFLFKEEKLEKYRDLWHLTHAQITIDGTEEYYNKIKNYKNVKGISPYKVLMNNMNWLTNKLHMGIAVRINMDLNNAENVKELIKELKMTFGNNNLINPYCYPVFDSYGNKRTDEENEKLFTYLKECDQLLDLYGYGSKNFRYHHIRSCHCMADHGHAVVISPEGDLGLCEHYSETEFWGHINDPKKRDIEEMKSFQEYVEPQEVCHTCPVLPDCTIPKKCQDLRECNQWKKEWRTRQAHDDVKFMYKEFIRKTRNNTCNSNNINNCNNGNCNIPNNVNNNVIHNKEICNCNNTKVENKKNGLNKFFENILILIGLK